MGRKKGAKGEKVIRTPTIEPIVIRLLIDPTLTWDDKVELLRSRYGFKISVPTLRGYRDNFLSKLAPEERAKYDKISNALDVAKKIVRYQYVDLDKGTIAFLEDYLQRLNAEVAILSESQKSKTPSSSVANSINSLSRTVMEVKIKLDSMKKEVGSETNVTQLLEAVAYQIVDVVTTCSDPDTAKKVCNEMKIRLRNIEDSFTR